MQWLIDIAIAAMKAWYALYGGFHDRGDPATWDFVTGDFTTDNAWHELDLSAIVPAAASAVLLSTYVRDNAVSSRLQFRRAGNSNDKNVSTINTQVSEIYKYLDQIVPLSADRKIEYRSDVVTWMIIRLTVKGWWF